MIGNGAIQVFGYDLCLFPSFPMYLDSCRMCKLTNQLQCMEAGEGPCYRHADCCGYNQEDGLGCLNLPGQEFGACVKKDGTFEVPTQE